MKSFASAALLILCLPCGAMRAQRTTHNIAYTQLSGGETADLYEPEGAGPFPVIIYIHGGSWRSGNKDVYKKLATDLAGQGYVGFAIDYDLKPRSFPLSWEQARDAVRFVRAHAVEYRVDPERVVVAGDSAGGELAALLALAPEGPASTRNAAPVPVTAALLFNGVYRLCSPAHVIKRYLGDDALCGDASPMQHVHAGAPPFFIGHGTADTTVPFSEASAFSDALRGQKVYVVNYDADGGPHSYWRSEKFYAANLARVEDFLKAKVGAASGK